MDSAPTPVATDPPASPRPVLTVDGVGQRYGMLLLFRRLSFKVEGGTSLAVTGANGSGKSTLLRILAGVLTPKAGSVTLTVDGAPVPDEMRPLRTGLVAPYLNVYDGLTARENLAFVAQARGRDPDDVSGRIEEVLGQVGLSGREDDLVETYSSGMKQRVKYAAALLPKPPLLLLDEPSANLDVAGTEMVDRVMRLQRESGRLLVVATNLPDEAAACDRSVRIENHR